jgi:hypothetical protein
MLSSAACLVAKGLLLHRRRPVVLPLQCVCSLPMLHWLRRHARARLEY